MCVSILFLKCNIDWRVHRFSHLKICVSIKKFINKTNKSGTSVCTPITYFSFCFRNLKLSENPG